MAVSARKQISSSNRSRQNLVLIVPLLVLLVLRLAYWRNHVSAAADFVLCGLGMMSVLGGLWLRVCARQWKAEHAHRGLVTDGLYGYIRHPLYVGSGLLGVGLCLVIGDPVLLLAFLALFGINHGMVIRREESDLETVFGDAYRTYRARVPSLFPRPGQGQPPIVPERLREAVVREGDALCVWLALPLFIQLGEWLTAVRGPETTQMAWYPTLLILAISILAATWLHLKLEWRTLITRERQRR